MSTVSVTTQKRTGNIVYQWRNHGVVPLRGLFAAAVILAMGYGTSTITAQHLPENFERKMVQLADQIPANFGAFGALIVEIVQSAPRLVPQITALLSMAAMFPPLVGFMNALVERVPDSSTVSQPTSTFNGPCSVVNRVLRLFLTITLISPARISVVLLRLFVPWLSGHLVTASNLLELSAMATAAPRHVQEIHGVNLQRISETPTMFTTIPVVVLFNVYAAIVSSVAIAYRFCTASFFEDAANWLTDYAGRTEKWFGVPATVVGNASPVVLAVFIFAVSIAIIHSSLELLFAKIYDCCSDTNQHGTNTSLISTAVPINDRAHSSAATDQAAEDTQSTLGNLANKVLGILNSTLNILSLGLFAKYIPTQSTNNQVVYSSTTE